jgi:hypothetical protein
LLYSVPSTYAVIDGYYDRRLFPGKIWLRQT